MATNESDSGVQPSPGVDNPTRTDRQQDAAPPRVVNSEALMGGATQLAIRHNQSIYFLRQTRSGKLILTK